MIKSALVVALVMVACISVRPARAVELSLCPEPKAPPDRAREQRYLDPDGDVRVLSVSSLRADGACVRVELPVAQDAVRWLGLARAPSLPGRIDLHSRGQRGDLEIESSDLLPDRPPATFDDAALVAAPLALDLLPRLAARAYGIEQRARVERSDEGIALFCQSGARPAGAVLSAPAWRAPAGVSSALLLEGRGEGQFAVGLVDAEAERRGAPLPLGAFAAASRDSVERFVLPDVIAAGKAPLAWSLACPESGGTVWLRSLRLAAPVAAPPPPRAAWAWDPARWRSGGEPLLEAAVELAIERLYIAVPIRGDAVADPERLARFVAAAFDRGIAVWAVEGDPRAVLPAERAKFLSRARALSRYNAVRGKGSRLAGIQYDIEPYLLEGYALDPPRWREAYAATIAALAGTAGMPIEAALPFWLGEDEGQAARFLESLAPHVASIVVMDYRTDPVDIQAGAVPFLAWGALARKPVWIALENGPLEDEVIARYRSAEAGELWAMDLGPDIALVLLAAPSAAPRGRAYALEGRFTAPAGRTSFLGERERLLSLLPRLAEALRAWPSFAGLALHGVL